MRAFGAIFRVAFRIWGLWQLVKCLFEVCVLCDYCQCSCVRASLFRSMRIAHKVSLQKYLNSKFRRYPDAIAHLWLTSRIITLFIYFFSELKLLLLKQLPEKKMNRFVSNWITKKKVIIIRQGEPENACEPREERIKFHITQTFVE